MEAVKQVPNGQLKNELECHIDKHLEKLERRLERLSERNASRSITKDLNKLSNSGHAKLKEVDEEKLQLVYNLMLKYPQKPDESFLEGSSSRDKMLVYKLFLKSALDREGVSDKNIKSVLQSLELMTNEQRMDNEAEFNWLLQMEVLLQLSVNSRPYGVTRVLKLLFEMTENDVKFCIEKNDCIRAGHMVAILERFLVSCHLQVIGKTLKLPEEKAYTCYMTALLSGYVDLHCVNSSEISKKKLLGFQLCGFVSHILSLWPERLLEVLIQLSCVTVDTAKVVLPLVNKCLSVKPAGKGHSFYLKYVLLVRLLKNNIGSLDRVQEWIIATKEVPAEKGFCDWLQRTCPECVEHIPFEDRKFKKRVVTRFLLLEADNELIDLLMNSLYNQTSSEVAEDHKDVSMETESNNLFFLDTVAMLQEPVYLNTIEDLECLLDKTDNEQHVYRINPDLISKRFTDPDDQKFMKSDIVSITRVSSDDQTYMEDIGNEGGEIVVGDASSKKQIQIKRAVVKSSPIVNKDCRGTLKDSLSSSKLNFKLSNSNAEKTDSVISIADSDEDIAVDALQETCDNNKDVHQQCHNLNKLTKLDSSLQYDDNNSISRNKTVVSEADDENECIAINEVDEHRCTDDEGSIVCDSAATIASVLYTGSQRDSKATSIPKSSLKADNEEKISKNDEGSKVRHCSNAVFANVYYTRSQRRSRGRLTPKSSLENNNEQTINKVAEGSTKLDNDADYTKSPRRSISKATPKSSVKDNNEALIAKDEEGNSALDNDANVHPTQSPRLSGPKPTSKTAESSIEADSDASNSYITEVKPQSTSRTLLKNVEDNVKSGFDISVEDRKLVMSRRSLPAKATLSKGNIQSDHYSANSHVNPVKSVNRLFTRPVPVDVGCTSESDCGNASPCRRSLRLKNVSKVLKEKTDSDADETYTSIKSKRSLPKSAVKGAPTKPEQQKTPNANGQSKKALRRNLDEYDFNSETESVDQLDVKKNVSYKGLLNLSAKKDSAIKSQPSDSSVTSRNMSSSLTKQVKKSESLHSARKRRLTVTGRLEFSGNEFDDVSNSKVAKITAVEKKTSKCISSSPAAINRQPIADAATCSSDFLRKK